MLHGGGTICVKPAGLENLKARNPASAADCVAERLAHALGDMSLLPGGNTKSLQYAQFADDSSWKAGAIASTVNHQVVQQSITKYLIVPTPGDRIGDARVVPAKLLGLVATWDPAQPEMRLAQKDFVAINDCRALGLPALSRTVGPGIRTVAMKELELDHGFRAGQSQCVSSVRLSVMSNGAGTVSTAI